MVVVVLDAPAVTVPSGMMRPMVSFISIDPSPTPVASPSPIIVSVVVMRCGVVVSEPVMPGARIARAEQPRPNYERYRSCPRQPFGQHDYPLALRKKRRLAEVT